MMKKIIVGLLLLQPFCFTLGLYGQTWDFDLTKPQPAYTDQTGYGYDRNTEAGTKGQKQPMFFSVKVPEGDYKVTVTLGSKEYAGCTA